MKKYLTLCALSATFFSMFAQSEVVKASDRESVIRSGWFVETGLDMTLQNPYGYDFGQVFPNGKSFGVDVAVGKWMAPALGLRSRINWENGISLLENHHLNWLAPYNKPGRNMEKGGYVSMVADFMVNPIRLASGDVADRRWDFLLFGRTGLVYNFGCSKGSPLIGAGIENAYRLSGPWQLYLDVAYNGVSQGFSSDGANDTGIGNGSNMYFTADLGLRYLIGAHDFGGRSKARRSYDGLWSNWFLQMGADMTLYNPSEKDFSKAMSKGRALGVDVALGKWFSPEMALRGRLNWENGLIKNPDMEWLPFDKAKDKDCYDGGGCLMLYLDALVSAKNFFLGYNPADQWDMYVVMRMGLGKNLSLDSLSPVVGGGFGTSRRLNDRWSVFAESVYSGITSEFFNGVSWSGREGTRFNGIWDFNVGVELRLGK